MAPASATAALAAILLFAAHLSQAAETPAGRLSGSFSYAHTPRPKRCVTPSLVVNQQDNQFDEPLSPANQDRLGSVVGASCGRGKFKQCCAPYTCQAGPSTSDPAPFKVNLKPITDGDGGMCSTDTEYDPSTLSSDSRCCVSNDVATEGDNFVDITPLVCPSLTIAGQCIPEGDGVNGPLKLRGAINDGSNPSRDFYGIFTTESGDRAVAAQKARDNLACICCSGEVFIIKDADSGNRFVLCNGFPSDPPGINPESQGTCPMSKAGKW